MTASELAPNHHAHHGGFAGVSGFLAACTMLRGRDGDARTAWRLSGAGPGDLVVDVGCGPGVAARHAARAGATVIGVDPAPVMRRVARWTTRPGAAVTFVAGAAEDLPVDDFAAAAAWSIACVHHWPDLDAGLREVRRILRAGAHFVAMERVVAAGAHGLASHGWTRTQAEAFARRCEDAGFVDLHVEQVTDGGRTMFAVVATAPGDRGPATA
jgi:SAM-dependent methyltransferase